MNIEVLRKESLKLPKLPGVYNMKNAKGDVIYVGKAKNLKNRVSQYFTRLSSHTVKVSKMVENIDRFEFIITASEVEALVLECSLIKQYMPKYNILLKDDKGYSYIKIGTGDYPKITAERKKGTDGEYIGPFMSFFSVRQSVDAANQVFMLPTCSLNFPKDFRKSRPCLNYHIGRCKGFCRGNISVEEYGEILKEAVSFIKKGEKETIKFLEGEMERLSLEMEFEKAAVLRDKIRAISRISERQNVRVSGQKSKDYFAFLRHEKGVLVSVLSFKGGVLRDKADYSFDLVEDIKEAVSDFLIGFYDERAIPEYIFTDEFPDGKEALEEYLSGKKGKSVRIYKGEKGENAKIIALARENAAERIAFYSRLRGSAVSVLSETAKMLGLKTPPRHIESADISNTGTDSMVGVLVVFKDAVPYKKAYKRFSIDDLPTENDPAALASVFRRRFLRYLDENETDEGFKTLPDLILLDGGKGQVSAVRKVLEELKISVPIFGIVKDEHHRARGLTDAKGEIEVKRTDSVYRLISDISEEVHRFAITYHRKKRVKSSMENTLTKVSGIGDKTAAKLFRKYKSLSAIRGHTAEEISKDIKIPLAVAERLLVFLNERG